MLGLEVNGQIFQCLQNILNSAYFAPNKFLTFIDLMYWFLLSNESSYFLQC